MERLPYVIVIVNGKNKILPYPEAQEFTIYEIPKSSVFYLTVEELKRLEEEINE